MAATDESPMNILLVEDNDDHAMIIIRNLRKEPWVKNIFRVADGVEALQYLKKQKAFQDVEVPDIVLLDLNLPRLDGHEVLAEVKADDELRKIPIIVLTTSDADRDKIKAYYLHANSYLVKPLRAEDLKQMIGNMASYWGQWNRTPPVEVSKKHGG